MNLGASAEIGPGLYVIAVPTVWKSESGDLPDEVCGHVARQTFGEHARLYVPPDLETGAKMYEKALYAVGVACERAGRSLELFDPFDYIVRIGGPTWKEAGYRWVRIVDTRES